MPVKLYIPDGHLEAKTLELFERAGFRIEVSDRSYLPRVDDPELVLKRLRPQDFPFMLAVGRGDLGITGYDILLEFKLKHPSYGEKLIELLDLGYGKTRMCAAVSEEVYPEVRSIEDFREVTKQREVVVATEYPNITKKYLADHGLLGAIIRKPAGKTEAWVVPPMPEADLIVDTVETGRTLQENRCRIIDVVLESTARLIANKESLKDEGKRGKIEEIVELLRGALRAKGKVNVYMNVVDPKDLKKVLEVLKEHVEKPTISQLEGGGYDVFVVIEEEKLKYMIPKLKQSGASSIAVSDTRMLID